MQTLATLQYGGLVFTAVVVALIALKRFGVLAKLGDGQVIRRTVFGGTIVFGVALGISFCRDVLHARASARTADCISNIFAWAFVTQYYHEVHDALPPSTKTVNGHKHSWRVLLAPYYEGDRIRDEYNFDLPWNSPENLALEDDARTYHQCPERRGKVDPIQTSYVAITGPNCVMRDDSYPPRRFEDIDPEAVLFVETKRTDIHWMEPKDLSYERLIADRQYAESVIGGSHSNGGNYATVNGRIRPIASIGIDELLRRCIVKESASPPPKHTQTFDR